jgi:EAL domain-containing protein (putative c-di-GMP-specific phosphodiesterase class I)
MYHSKRFGKNRVSTYEESVTSDIFKLKAALHLGVQNGEFFLEYQHLFNSERKLVGVEALMRWGSGTLPKVSPDTFIPAAEESGLMPYLGSWALSYACQDLKRLHKLAPEISVYVNVSSFQFKERDFYETVVETINVSGVSPSNIVLEVKESIFSERRSAGETLKRLGDLGLRFSIDNFGTGLSNFSVLTDLPIASIKIDKSLVANVGGNDAVKTKLVTSLIHLVKSIGLTCVAEGIENETQFNVLKGAQCDIFQGYYLGNPVSVESIEKILSAVGKKGEV